MNERNCSTCGAALRGSSICSHCGTLIGVELVLSRMRSRARSFLELCRHSIPTVKPHHFLWACALMPLFILPPLFSLVLSVVAMRAPKESSMHSTQEWIAIVSLVNMVLSGLMLYKFHFSPAEILGALVSLLSAIARGLLNLVPIGGTPAPGPRITPI